MQSPLNLGVKSPPDFRRFQSPPIQAKGKDSAAWWELHGKSQPPPPPEASTGQPSPLRPSNRATPPAQRRAGASHQLQQSPAARPPIAPSPTPQKRYEPQSGVPSLTGSPGPSNTMGISQDAQQYEARIQQLLTRETQVRAELQLQIVQAQDRQTAAEKTAADALRELQEARRQLAALPNQSSQRQQQEQLKQDISRHYQEAMAKERQTLQDQAAQQLEAMKQDFEQKLQMLQQAYEKQVALLRQTQEEEMSNLRSGIAAESHNLHTADSVLQQREAELQERIRQHNAVVARFEQDASSRGVLMQRKAEEDVDRAVARIEAEAEKQVTERVAKQVEELRRTIEKQIESRWKQESEQIIADRVATGVTAAVAETEQRVRTELRSAVERKMREQLLQKMKPAVRAQLVDELRDDVRAELALELARELEHQIRMEIAEQQGIQGAMPAEMAADLERRFAVQLEEEVSFARKEALEQARLEQEAEVKEKVQAALKVRLRNERAAMKKEFIEKQCDEAKQYIEAAQQKLKEERQELLDMRAKDGMKRRKENDELRKACKSLEAHKIELEKSVRVEERKLAELSASRINIEQTLNETVLSEAPAPTPAPVTNTSHNTSSASRSRAGTRSREPPLLLTSATRSRPRSSANAARKAGRGDKKAAGLSTVKKGGVGGSVASGRGTSTSSRLDDAIARGLRAVESKKKSGSGTDHKPRVPSMTQTVFNSGMSSSNGSAGVVLRNPLKNASYRATSTPSTADDTQGPGASQEEGRTQEEDVFGLFTSPPQIHNQNGNSSGLGGAGTASEDSRVSQLGMESNQSTASPVTAALLQGRLPSVDEVRGQDSPLLMELSPDPATPPPARPMRPSPLAPSTDKAGPGRTQVHIPRLDFSSLKGRSPSPKMDSVGSRKRTEEQELQKKKRQEQQQAQEEEEARKREGIQELAGREQARRERREQERKEQQAIAAAEQLEQQQQQALPSVDSASVEVAVATGAPSSDFFAASFDPAAFANQLISEARAATFAPLAPPTTLPAPTVTDANPPSSPVVLPPASLPAVTRTPVVATASSSGVRRDHERIDAANSGDSGDIRDIPQAPPVLTPVPPLTSLGPAAGSPVWGDVSSIQGTDATRHEFDSQDTPKTDTRALGAPIPATTTATSTTTTGAGDGGPADIQATSPAATSSATSSSPQDEDALEEWLAQTYTPWMPSSSSSSQQSGALRERLDKLHHLWKRLEISYIRRRDFDSEIMSLPPTIAMSKISAEISRLQKLMPLMGQEMALVTQREDMRVQLETLVRDEKEEKENTVAREQIQLARQVVQTELRRLTGHLLTTLGQWEARHGLRFVYRGRPYIDTLQSGISLPR